METADVPPTVEPVINIDAMRDQAAQEIVNLLEMIPGKKVLVLDQKLSGPLGLVVEVPLLKSHGVESIYHLTSEVLETDSDNIVYLCHPRVEYMKTIARHIHHDKKQGKEKRYCIVFVPRRTIIAERVLEEEDVYTCVQIEEFPLDLIPFEKDVFSLELDDSYRQCTLEGDTTSLFYVARGIMKLQSVYGLIPQISGKGPLALHVKELLIRMRRENANEIAGVDGEIQHLILIDRHVDPLTPMPTQLTYEGLIDEIFGITNGYVHLQPEMIPTKEGQPPPQTTRNGTVSTPLNANDMMYSLIRDLNFAVLGPFLNGKAKEIRDYYKIKEEIKAGKKSISEMKEFVKYYKDVISKLENGLQLHLGVAEHISAVTKSDDFHKRLEAEQRMLMGTSPALEYIEDCIFQNHALLKVLRLLILHSLTLDGIKGKVYDQLVQDILQTYGYEYQAPLRNLEKLGFLKRSETVKTSFMRLRKGLNLINQEVDDKQPNDIAYVYSGYAPLSVRLIEIMSSSKWDPTNDVIAQVPGKAFQTFQPLRLPNTAAASASSSSSSSQIREIRVAFSPCVGQNSCHFTITNEGLQCVATPDSPPSLPPYEEQLPFPEI
uniref:Vacuolar protein sorting-associated protein 33A n=1 Tax=Paramoeba aestuarina TaxID=180227 RepID=A0A7S4KP01_9EUKA|mmetsp:Transcript_22575/g.35106  ORF Transcript_22575/g.35106 Transcript_22575/m.35106 type:complete len:603 (+) Transcript_22575:101-1909(+)